MISYIIIIYIVTCYCIFGCKNPYNRIIMLLCTSQNDYHENMLQIVTKCYEMSRNVTKCHEKRSKKSQKSQKVKIQSKY